MYLFFREQAYSIWLGIIIRKYEATKKCKNILNKFCWNNKKILLNISNQFFHKWSSFLLFPIFALNLPLFSIGQ